MTRKWLASALSIGAMMIVSFYVAHTASQDEHYRSVVEEAGGEIIPDSSGLRLEFYAIGTPSNGYGEMLRQIKSWRSITSLKIGGVGDTEFDAICAIESLRGLELHSADITPEGWKAAARANLSGLAVEYMPIPKEAMSAVSRNASLTSLCIIRCKIEPDAFLGLIGNTKLTDITILDSHLSDESCGILATIPSLIHLILANNDLTDEALFMLGGSKRLSYLEFKRNKTTLKGLDGLKRCTNLTTWSVDSDLIDKARKNLPQIQKIF